MSAIFLMSMLFLHIVADFHLQGILAKFKQKSWWNANAPDRSYRYDYIISLMLHGFEWSFMIHLPFIVVLTIGWAQGTTIGPLAITLSVVGHACFHAMIDDWKANSNIINLITDQLIHIGQIVAVWLVFLRLT